MNCRSEEKRKQIVEMYNLQVITYATILNGIEKKSCTGDKLERRYYEFLCQLKTDTNRTKIITCGEYAGNHFLELCNLKKPKIFNPLVSDKIETIVDGENTYIKVDTENGNEVWNRLAYDLYMALNWLSVCWKKELNGHLLEKKIKLINNPTEEPVEAVIKSVNTSIKKGRRKLPIMINELRKNNDIREYNFTSLNEYIKKLNDVKSINREKIESYF